MKRLKDIFYQTQSTLRKGEICTATRDTEDLIANLLDVKPLEIYLHFDELFPKEKEATLVSMIERRLKKEPIAYIIGQVIFLDCPLNINQNVLIPRPETELLAAEIIKEIKALPHKNKILWDVCTGSGCLGISIKKHLPDLHVTLSDLSVEALKVAKANAEKNGVSIRLLQGDLLTPFKGETFDYLVCNPPYISLSEKETLSKEVLDFEPNLALFAKEEGLSLYRKLASTLPHYAKKGSRLWLELGQSQGQAVSSLFHNQGMIKKDFAGHDRFFSLEME